MFVQVWNLESFDWYRLPCMMKFQWSPFFQI